MDSVSWLLPLLLIAIFYFLLIRPQQRQRRQLAELQQAIQPGTRVMTSAGLLATVVTIDDDEVVLEVAPGVHNRYVRRAIASVISPEEPAAPTNNESPLTSEETERPHEDRTNGDDVR
jgi:preprotein translocase subunit YajC